MIICNIFLGKISVTKIIELSRNTGFDIPVIIFGLLNLNLERCKQMSDDNEVFVQGLPEWTEHSLTRVQDPLGMQRPIEQIYQKLMPGMSTTTVRYRYYSFYCWIVRLYVKKGNATDSYPQFRSFIRKSEALYALLSVWNTKDVGIAGSNWATKKLKGVYGNDLEIDFLEDADPSNGNPTYLANDAFSSAYSTQMYQMGIIGYNDDLFQKIPCCSERAEELANGFEEMVGDWKEDVIRALETGKIETNLLNELSILRPSNIDSGSKEHRELTSFLLVKHNSPTASDLHRKKSMELLLCLIKKLGKKPSVNETKWLFFEYESNGIFESENKEQLKYWKLYNMFSLFRFAYDSLLILGLTILKDEPIPIQNLIDKMLEYGNFSEELSAEDWFQDKCVGKQLEEIVRQSAENLVEKDTRESICIFNNAILIIFALVRLIDKMDYSELKLSKLHKNFQSLETESILLKKKWQSPMKNVMYDLLRDGILLRHLKVATLKLGYTGKNYTFLFEADENGLLYRREYKTPDGNPRIHQALNFLEDLSYIDIP